jgi:hypothetical protein
MKWMRPAAPATREASPLTTAVIFVPIDNIELYATQCYDYCIAMDYEVTGIVRGDFAAAFAMLIDHSADVLVVARPEHLDGIDVDGEVPRIEFAVPPDPDHVRKDERNTRINRPGEAT